MSDSPVLLLTGASGVVGSALLSHLADSGPVVALTHHKPTAGHTRRGDVTRPWLGLTPTDYRELAAAVDVVIHCAALVNFGSAPRNLHRVNVRGVGHVLRFVEDADARLVHCSTAFISRIRPDATLNAYAESKQAGETLVRESGLPATIARISTVIGDTRTGAVARLQAFHYLVGLAMWGHLPFLPCTPATRIDLLPTDVIAAALAALARNPAARDDYWITAGPAALPMQHVVDVGSKTALTMLGERAPRDLGVDLRQLRPRLVDPGLYHDVISSVLTAGTDPDTSPSALRHIPGLMAPYNDAPPFPTSLGDIPGGPPPLTEDHADQALRATCRYLATMPKDTWKMSW
ncbi:SDR family oxidoreductase [Streptomyces sp. NPDC057116]|uniref:SDR family oxidoreductase n=1 Tax=Streptomyces sp. NPDC057116 TaxID=3346023 RepID=UPI003639E2E3